MQPLEKETVEICQEHQLFRAGERIVVGVSGGPDSMALLHVLHAIALQLQIELIVAHVNHGLRSAESDRDEEFVKEQAAARGILFEARRVEVKHRAASEGLSIEEAARELRYDFFHAVLAQHAASKIVVAHTADDQAEEVLLRLIRGTGRRGLAGMEMIRDQLIVRPFLQVTKQEILAYLQENRVPYRLDSSNEDRTFLRNRVRLDLLPFIADSMNPNISQVLRQTAAILHDEDIFLDSVSAQAYQKIAAVQIDTLSGLPVVQCSLADFRVLPKAIQRRVLEKAILQMGGKVGFRQIEALVALAVSDGYGCMHLAKGLRGSKDETSLTFSFPEGKESRRGNLGAGAPNDFALIVESPGTYALPEIDRMVTLEVLDQVSLPAVQERGREDYLDVAKCSFPLEIRQRRDGDRFHPLGAPGAKKVADFLSDSKVPRSERQLVPVLLSAGKIIAVLGQRIDHHVRITDATCKVLRVALSPLRKA